MGYVRYINNNNNNNNNIIMGFAVAFPRGGSSSTVSRSNWNLEVLVFDERGKPEYPEKNLSEQSREPTTNSTHI